MLWAQPAMPRGQAGAKGKAVVGKNKAITAVYLANHNSSERHAAGFPLYRD